MANTPSHDDIVAMFFKGYGEATGLHFASICAHCGRYYSEHGGSGECGPQFKPEKLLPSMTGRWVPATSLATSMLEKTRAPLPGWQQSTPFNHFPDLEGWTHRSGDVRDGDLRKPGEWPQVHPLQRFR